MKNKSQVKNEGRESFGNAMYIKKAGTIKYILLSFIRKVIKIISTFLAYTDMCLIARKIKHFILGVMSISADGYKSNFLLKR